MLKIGSLQCFVNILIIVDKLLKKCHLRINNLVYFCCVGKLRHNIVCMHCGKESVVKHSGAVYCSNGCKQQSYLLRKSDREQSILRKSNEDLRKTLRKAGAELRNAVTEKENLIRYVESGGPIKVLDSDNNQSLTYQYEKGKWCLLDEQGNEVKKNMRTLAKGEPGHTEGCFCCGRQNYPNVFNYEIVNVKKNIRACICSDCNYHFIWEYGAWECKRLCEQGYTVKSNYKRK